MVQIINLPPERWQEYETLRLESLHDSPAAFLDTPEEFAKSDKAVLRNRLNVNESSPSRSFFAEDDGKIVGIIAGVFEDRDKRRHIGNIVSFYVSPEYRGKGLGSMLMQAVMDWLKSKPFIEILRVMVYKTNPAINLYKRFGFEIVAELKNEIKVDGKYYDEFIMELKVK